MGFVTPQLAFHPSNPVSIESLTLPIVLPKLIESSPEFFASWKKTRFTKYEMDECEKTLKRANVKDEILKNVLNSLHIFKQRFPNSAPDNVPPSPHALDEEVEVVTNENPVTADEIEKHFPSYCREVIVAYLGKKLQVQDHPLLGCFLQSKLVPGSRIDSKKSEKRDLAMLWDVKKRIIFFRVRDEREWRGLAERVLSLFAAEIGLSAEAKHQLVSFFFKMRLYCKSLEEGMALVEEELTPQEQGFIKK
jgi:hypothetical protein